MKETLTLKISKKNFNKALKVLSVGAKTHKKYADEYVVAFRVDTPGKVSVSVPGGKYSVDAETSGCGCFVLNYKCIKMYIKECEKKSLELILDSGQLTINGTTTIEVKQFTGDIDIPLSLSYSVGELARMDLTGIDEGLLDFWGLASQVEDARLEVEGVVDSVYLQVAKYLPPQLTSNGFKAQLRKLLLEVSEAVD